MASRRTGRWLGLVGATVVTVTVGLAARSPGLLVLGGAGVALAAYRHVADPPAPQIGVERRLDPEEPKTGESVAVELTVRNAGERFLPDVRIADGVPASLRVVDGAATAGTALRPGEAATLEYEVASGTGHRRFDPVVVETRDVVGVVRQRTQARPATDAITWTASAADAELPLRVERSRRPGRVTTPDPGEGVSLHSVREYRPGDPLASVDWRRLARTGEFATVRYQRERAATVVVLVDARRAAALAPSPDDESAIERAASAAAALVDALPAAGHSVGLAALGARSAWLEPGRGETHQRRAADLLADHPAFGPTGTAARRDGTVLERIPASAEVLFLTPLCDDDSEEAARRLDARGNPVTVVSPDPTAADTPGHRVARLERRERLRGLRAAGIPCHDWPTDESFEHVAARARRSR